MALAPVIFTQKYDFETVNVWGHIYPEPAAGPVSTSELSSEQAASGKKSLMWSISFPDDTQAKTWRLKFFSEKFNYTKPVRAIKFQLYGNDSGASFNLRVRDKTGECWYGQTLKIDWTGWREIVWNLHSTPLPRITGGNANRVMDPPLEMILEGIFPRPAGGAPLVLYVDDLEIAFIE